MVEITRAAAASMLDVGAAVASGLAAAAVLALAVILPAAQERPLVRRLLWLQATALAATELLLRAAAAAALTPVATDRRGLALLARLVALATVAGLEFAGRRSIVTQAERRAGHIVLTVLLVATVPLALPATGDPPGLLPGIVLTAALGAVVATVVLVATRLTPRPRVHIGAVVAITLAAGAVTGALVAPDRVPPPVVERLTVDGTALDVTIAPAATGRNEVHLYAWDGQTRPAALSEVVMTATGPSAVTTAELVAISPNHHLTYEFVLPDPGPWTLDVTATRDDGSNISARLHLEAP